MWIDCHNHCSAREGRWPSIEDLVANAGKLGIGRICCSCPLVGPTAEPKDIEAANDDIMESMRRYPDVILGQCFVNPGYARHTQDEITRCIVDGGMLGVKLYHQYRIDEPVQFPLIERCIDLGVPILMHAGHPTDATTRARQPRISGGEHFASVAKRYPEAMLICGHVGGRGDWAWQIKTLREAPNVYLDTSGSVIDAGMIERCVRDLGAKRLLFATDMSHARGVGKLLDADITERQRKRIAWQNFEGILAKRRC